MAETTTAQNPNVQIPEWDQHGKTADIPAAPARSGAGTRLSLRSRFDRTMSPHRKYFGLRRRTFLIIIVAIVLALLALIIGLAVGLTKKKK